MRTDRLRVRLCVTCRQGRNSRFGKILQVFPHVFRQNTKANAREVIDGKAGVARVVQGEKSLEAGSQNFIPHALLQLRKAKMFS